MARVHAGCTQGACRVPCPPARLPARPPRGAASTPQTLLGERVEHSPCGCLGLKENVSLQGWGGAIFLVWFDSFFLLTLSLKPHPYVVSF